MSPPHRYADYTAAAEYVGVKPRTIRAMVASGRIPAYRLSPRIVRVDLNALDAIMGGAS